MTKEQIKAFGGRKRFRPFIIVFESGQRVEVSRPNQMVFAPHPDEAIIYYQGSWRVLALSRIDHLELIPVAERLCRLLVDRANQQFLAAVAAQVVSVCAITALALAGSSLFRLKNSP
jgi:hypothetical protein